MRIKKDAVFKPHPYVQWLFPEKCLAFACTAPVYAPAKDTLHVSAAEGKAMMTNRSISRAIYI